MYDGETAVTSGANLITLGSSNEDDSVTKNLTLKLDQSKITKADTYSGTMTFTVNFTDTEAE